MISWLVKLLSSKDSFYVKVTRRDNPDELHAGLVAVDEHGIVLSHDDGAAGYQVLPWDVIAEIVVELN